MSFEYHGIYGFDISTWQDSPVITGTVDFQKMRAFGARFCCLRATNGLTKDADFDTYRQNSKGIFAPFHYHYYNNLYAPKDQARKFFETIAPDIGICVLDLEDRQSGYRGWRHWYDWLTELQSLSGLPNECIWIYTNESYFEETSGPITQAQRDWFSRYPLWLASYFALPQTPDYQYINVPEPWTEIIMLQSGTPAIGLQAGVESLDIDYDQFNGDETKFLQLFGGVANVPQPPTGDADMEYYSVTANALNMRSYAEYVEDGSNVVGRLMRDDIVQADSVAAGGFRRIYAIWRANASVALPTSNTGQVWAHGGFLLPTLFTPPPVAALPDVLYIATQADMSDKKEYRKAA